MVNTLALWPQDKAFLAKNVYLKNNNLIDSMADRCIVLNEVAALLVGALSRRKSIGEAVDSVSAIYEWNSQEVISDLIDLLDELDKSALIVVKKDWKVRLNPSLLWLQFVSWMTLEWSRPVTKRYKPTAFWLAWACIRSGSLGVFLSFAMSLTLFIALMKNDPINVERKYIYSVIPFSLYVFCLFHVFIHELGHLTMATIVKHNCSKYVFSRGFSIGVAHSILTPPKRRTVALCGPIAGILGAQLVALFLLAFPFLSSYSLLISLSGLIHFYSLFPWTADGKQIWQRKEGDGES